jgi:hypothetical protein
VTLPARSLPAASPQEPDSAEESSPKAFIAVVGVAILVVVLCGLGAALSGVFNFGTGSPNTEAATTTDPNANQVPKVPGTKFSDGQWFVGGDIQAGTYAVTVAAGSPGCTWERNANTDGTASSVLESGNGAAGEALVVNIRQTDKVFQSRNCGTWQRTSD